MIKINCLIFTLAASCTCAPFGVAQARERATDLLDFDSASGFAPNAGVIADRRGVLYGTTPIGGTGPCFGGAGCGTVYALTPPSSHGAPWTISVPHAFQDSSDGESPMAPLAIDRAGSLYGYSYGSPGTVFQLSPDGGGGWIFNVLYTFTDGADGDLLDVSAPLIASHGDVYGVASGGSSACGQFQCGSLFRLKHLRDGTWRETTLYNFTGGADGGQPTWIAGPDAGGAFYVSTRLGDGAVSQISPPVSGASGGSWTEAVIARFNGKNGNTPTNLLLVPGGSVYGSAYKGRHGIVFQLTPPPQGETKWTRTTIADVNNHGYGADSLALEKDGSLVGTSFGDFDFFAGAVFQLTPPTNGGKWTYAELWNFNRGPDRNPLNIVPGYKGHLFGAMNGGDSTTGSLFELR